MPDIVHAVAGKEIQNAISLGSRKFNSLAACIANVHFQESKEPDPLRIHMVGIRTGVRGFGVRALMPIRLGKVFYNFQVSVTVCGKRHQKSPPYRNQLRAVDLSLNVLGLPVKAFCQTFTNPNNYLEIHEPGIHLWRAEKKVYKHWGLRTLSDGCPTSLGIKKTLDLRPISSDDIFGFQVPSAGQKPHFDSSGIRKIMH